MLRPSAPALGIDLGTSSVKAAVLAVTGELLGQSSAEYRVDTPHRGWSETDPESWWTATVTAVQQAVRAAGATPVAIGLCGQMHGVLLAYGSGRAVRPAMLWSDTRATAELGRYQGLPAAIRQRLGNPLSPGMAGPMLAWLSRNETAIYRSASWALQPKDWVRARLTGEFHSEPSDASATLLYDLGRQEWDVELAEILGVDPSILPPLLPTSATPAGRLTARAAAELDLPVGVPVAAGAADTAAAALGSGLVEPGAVQLTLGTGAQLLLPRAAPTQDELSERGSPTTHLYRSATDTGWYAMAAVLNGGLTLNWVRTALNASWAELYAAAERPAGAGDPIFVPHLHGERTPYLDTTLRASWARLAPEHDRVSLLRAALEGVAFAIAEARDALPGERNPEVRLAGGGSTSAPWRQLLADVLQVRLWAVDIPGASGRGAALLGARAAGLLDEAGWREIAAQPGSALVAEPRPETAGLMSERHCAFDEVFQSLRRS